MEWDEMRWDWKGHESGRAQSNMNHGELIKFLFFIFFFFFFFFFFFLVLFLILSFRFISSRLPFVRKCWTRPQLNRFSIKVTSGGIAGVAALSLGHCVTVRTIKPYPMNSSFVSFCSPSPLFLILFQSPSPPPLSTSLSLFLFPWPS